MTAGAQQPVKGEGKRAKRVQANEVLTHPLAAAENGASRDRYRYRFLRTTRQPTADRPESARILVENVATGKRTEHYAFLFNVRFQ